jgi:hypothetical protein
MILAIGIQNSLNLFTIYFIHIFLEVHLFKGIIWQFIFIITIIFMD